MHNISNSGTLPCISFFSTKLPQCNAVLAHLSHWLMMPNAKMHNISNSGTLPCISFFSTKLPQCNAVLAHLSHWLMMSYCYCWMSFIRRQLCVLYRVSSTIASKDISSKTTAWILTKLGNDVSYMALFHNCMWFRSVAYLGHRG